MTEIFKRSAFSARSKPRIRLSPALRPAASACAALLCCAASSCKAENAADPAAPKPATPSAAHAGIAAAIGAEIADTVEKVMPSVVVVRTEAVEYETAQDIFRGYLYRIPRRLAGLGSGVIITPEGHVLTCNHVVSDADKIEVVTSDSVIYPAEIMGADREADLAVLKIRAEGRTFSAIEPADSDAVRVGELAIAIGSPFSLASSVTLGIVSQKGRAVGMLPYEDFIQTDAPINTGNSGGPLVDVSGRLIGINDMILTGSPVSMGNVGIGFAIPSNLAMDFARQILETGAFQRPRIGIAMGMLDPQEAEKSAGRPSAVVIAEVMRDSPAEKTGLRDGDIILEVDGQPAQNMQDVRRIILRHKVNEPVTMLVLREGKKLAVTLRTAAWEETPQRRK